MNFTNMRKEEYSDDEDDDAPDSDDDSDVDDPDYASDDDSSDGDDDDYDDFIAGVNGNGIAPDLPIEEEDESVEDSDNEEAIDDNIDETSDDDKASDNDDEIDDEIVVTPALKNLTDYYGTMPPVIKPRTRSQANETGEHLLIIEE